MWVIGLLNYNSRTRRGFGMHILIGRFSYFVTCVIVKLKCCLSPFQSINGFKVHVHNFSLRVGDNKVAK